MNSCNSSGNVFFFSTAITLWYQNSFQNDGLNLKCLLVLQTHCWTKIGPHPSSHRTVKNKFEIILNSKAANVLDFELVS